MLQLAELKAYGTPYLDIDGAKADMELYLNNGGKKDSGEYKAVAEALENAATTQKKLNILLSSMLDSANVVKEKETEAETEAATAAEYEFDYSVLEKPAVETETDAETETETDAETAEATDAEPTDTVKEPAQTDAETTGEKDNGGAVKTAVIIGAAVLGAAMLAGAIIYALKKKKK